MKALVTGADGFIGKNLCLKLQELGQVEIIKFSRHHEATQLGQLVEEADFIFHLAGVNRPKEDKEFIVGNTDLTKTLASFVAKKTERGIKTPVVYTSSTQATNGTTYGLSKLAAEEVLEELHQEYDIPIFIFRLPNVFGKWSRPNYNSVVATFCNNIARDLPIEIKDANIRLNLVYIDDVIDAFLRILSTQDKVTHEGNFASVEPVYQISLGELSELLQSFKESRKNLVIERVGVGLTRALYSTYVSFLPPAQFGYSIPRHGDARGVFVEMLKTPDAGQFSYFTAHPGITRGGHYHHSKTEKFLVIKGKALFKFRHMETGETYSIETNGDDPKIVETVPGWTHDITNIGDVEMIVMLWANEIFDRTRPDTISSPL